MFKLVRMTRIIRIRHFVLLASALTLCSCSGTSGNDGSGENVLNIYNWADYLPPEIIERFEVEYGIKVNIDFYDTTAIVDAKLLAGSTGYDVITHSNEFASRLTGLGIYEKLDMSKLGNTANLDPETMASIDLYPKVRGYTIPYHWGTTGYAWNVAMIRERLGDHPMDSGDVLFDPNVVSKLADCGVSLLDGPTSLIPMVLAYLGRDPNAVDDESLAIAEAQLQLVRPYIRYFSNDKYLSDLPNKETCVAMSWSGDYAISEIRAKEAGVDVELRYTTPKEGTVLWVDGWYILADAAHKENAYKFLNFVLRGDIAADIANGVFYANANAASWPFTNPEIINNPAIYPDDDTWALTFAVTNVDPKRERPRTRTLARVKSGIK